MTPVPHLFLVPDLSRAIMIEDMDVPAPEVKDTEVPDVGVTGIEIDLSFPQFVHYTSNWDTPEGGYGCETLSVSCSRYFSLPSIILCDRPLQRSG
jgi:hypothetical protein